MKKLLLITLALTTSIINIYAQELTLNQNESTLQWTGKAAYTSYALTGSLKPKKGLIKMQGNTITELTVIIDMKSLYHDNNDLKRHLKSADFFEVKKYVEATFTLSISSKIVNGKTQLEGNMTIKGTTKSEVIPVVLNMLEESVILEFDTTFDRTSYGIKHNSPSFFKSLKENAIADEFKLSGKLIFNTY